MKVVMKSKNEEKKAVIGDNKYKTCKAAVKFVKRESCIKKIQKLKVRLNFSLFVTQCRTKECD